MDEKPYIEDGSNIIVFQQIDIMLRATNIIIAGNKHRDSRLSNLSQTSTLT